MFCLESQIIPVLQVGFFFRSDYQRPLLFSRIVLPVQQEACSVFFRYQRVLFNTFLANASNFGCWQYLQAFLLFLSYTVIVNSGSSFGLKLFLYVQKPWRWRRCKIGYFTVFSELNLNWIDTFDCATCFFIFSSVFLNSLCILLDITKFKTLK